MGQLASSALSDTAICEQRRHFTGIWAFTRSRSMFRQLIFLPCQGWRITWVLGVREHPLSTRVHSVITKNTPSALESEEKFIKRLTILTKIQQNMII